MIAPEGDVRHFLYQRIGSLTDAGYKVTAYRLSCLVLFSFKVLFKGSKQFVLVLSWLIYDKINRLNKAAK